MDSIFLYPGLSCYYSLTSYLISEMARCAVLMPAIYQDKAFKGKLSMPSKYTKVLGVKTESLSMFLCKPSRK